MTLSETLGTYQDVFASASSDVRQIADTLHAVILRLHPDVFVVPRTGEKSVSYGFGVKKMSESYCYLMPQKDYVNLGFPHGSELTDPNGLLEGTGKKYRHIKVRSVQQAESDSISEILEEAKQSRQAALK